MPIILLTNLNVHAGLVNGAQGIIIGFRNIWPEDQEMISDEFKLDCRYRYFCFVTGSN